MTQKDKDRIVAEIEKKISNYKVILNEVDKSRFDYLDSILSLESKIDVLQHILSFINTLEVKEEKEPVDALIEKACKWLEKNFNMPNDFEYHFRKAMERE